VKPCLLAIFFTLGVLACAKVEKKKVARAETTGSPLALRIGERATTDRVDVNVHELLELDGKSREEIFAIRRQYLEREPALFDAAAYQPSSFVFGRMEDGRPWWGVDGLYVHGKRGELAKAGLSADSDWIVNPFAIVGVDPFSFWELRANDAKAVGGRFEPKLVSVSWKPKARVVELNYDVSDYFALGYARSPEAAYGEILSLNTKNAQDLGFRYIYLDKAESKHIQFASGHDSAHDLRQFLRVHRGCKIPGGCNGEGRSMKELLFGIDQSPARVVGKLWYELPNSVSDPPDATFSIDISAGRSHEIVKLLGPETCREAGFYQSCYRQTYDECLARAQKHIPSCLESPAEWRKTLPTCFFQRFSADAKSVLKPEAQCSDPEAFKQHHEKRREVCRTLFPRDEIEGICGASLNLEYEGEYKEVVCNVRGGWHLAINLTRMSAPVAPLPTPLTKSRDQMYTAVPVGNLLLEMWSQPNTKGGSFKCDEDAVRELVERATARIQSSRL
jgi:hypothetical protein